MVNNLGITEGAWREAALRALAASHLGEGRDEAALEALLVARGMRCRRWGAGETIFAAGERPVGLYLLVSGAVGIRQDTLSGREIFLTDIQRPGELFGEVYFLLEQPYDISARSLKESAALVMSAPLFASAEGLELTRRLLRVVAEKAYQMNCRLRILGSGSLRGKIAQYLLLSGAAPPLSREALAARLAVARPSLSRTLALMEREGLIKMEGQRLTIGDRGRLEEYL